MNIGNNMLPPIEDIKFLAEMFVCEWYEATIDDDERKRIDKVLKILGYTSGLSEDTYFEIIERLN